MCAEIFEEGHQVIRVEIMSNVKERGLKRNANPRVSGGMPPSFTSPAEIFHARSMDLYRTPNKSQYLPRVLQANWSYFK